MSPRAGESHSTKGLKPTQKVDSHYAYMTVFIVLESSRGISLGAKGVGGEYIFILVSVLVCQFLIFQYLVNHMN